MKKISIILFMIIPMFVFGQVIKEYDSLHPSIRNGIGEEQEKEIVFFKAGGLNRDEDILVFNTRTKEEELIRYTGILEPKRIISSFYDPYAERSYVYVGDRNLPEFRFGWYGVEFKNKEFKIIDFIEDGDQGRRNNSRIDMGAYLLQSKYGYDKARGKHIENLLITEKISNKIVWQIQGDKNKTYHNVFWISGEWILQENIGRLGGLIKYNIYCDTLYNFVTKEERSFFPEIIIGYGKGYIVTTGKDFIGITIQDPDGHIIFRDETFELTGMLKNTRLTQLISFAYFDNPYVYYEVVTALGGVAVPYCTVILDLNKLNSCMTVGNQQQLCGIFPKD